MPKLIIKILLLSSFIVSSVFADEELSIFHQQGYVTESEPLGEEAFYARKAPMSSVSSGYFGFSCGPGLVNLKPEIYLYKNGYYVGEIRDEDRSKIQYNAGLYTGYGTNFNHFYIGGELGAFHNSFKKSVKEDMPEGSVTHQLEMEFSRPLEASFDVMPGYLNETRDLLFYGRIGLGIGWYKFTLKDSVGDASEGLNKFRMGYRLGVGMEYFLTSVVGLRVEYMFNILKGRTYDVSPSSKVYKYIYGMGRTGIHTINIGLSIHP